MERPHEHRDLLGGCAAVMLRKPGERQRPSTKVTIRRVPMRSSLGISRDGHVSGDRQRKTIRGFRQKRNLALDLLPYFGTFGKSEDELAVDQVCPRVQYSMVSGTIDWQRVQSDRPGVQVRSVDFL